MTVCLDAITLLEVRYCENDDFDVLSLSVVQRLKLEDINPEDISVSSKVEYFQTKPQGHLSQW
jgi:hypothetical protein